ncbi:MAG TPA: Gfo/Idh/MocA family oxidoreductase [Bacillota bacterium]
MMKTIKLGVLGVSKHFITRVLPGVLKSGCIEVYAIASRDSAKARQASEKFGIPLYYASYDELVKDKSLEIIYIPLPNHLHTEWIKRSADYGKHIICKKPLALNAHEAREAIDYATAKGVKIMEAFMYRFHPQWQRALEIVNSGEIGTLTTIHTIFGYFNADPANIRNIKSVGGGAIYDIGCYAVSSIRFLLQAEPRQVLCMLDRDPGFQTDIRANAILDFGEIRTLFTVGTQTFPAQSVEVYGTKGIMTIEIPFNPYPDSPAKIRIQSKGQTRILELGPADQYQLEFDSFADAILNNRPVPTPPEDAIHNQRVLDALFQSAQTGQWQKVD